jgi:uncharacterized protein DUF6249
MDFYFTLLLIALVFYAAFMQYLWHHRRILVHRERLAAVEKGIELPPLVEQEVKRRTWNVQRILLLAGLIWLSLGIGAFAVLSAVLAHPSPATADVPQGLQWIGVAPIGIGLSHLIVYAVGRKKDE